MARFFQLAGRSDYAAVHALQKELLERRIRREIPDVVLLLEHADTLTVGRALGAEANVLAPGDWPVVRVERGGDVTWHGPGQLVAYPIVALEGERADLHRFLRGLEEAVIGLLGDYGLRAGRDPRNTGVWLPEPAGDARKVCSIGVACRKWVTWHGLALNVRTDPAVWSRLRPCGFASDVMTRLADHLAPAPSVEGLVVPLASWLSRTLELPRDGAVRPVSSPEELLALL